MQLKALTEKQKLWLLSPIIVPIGIMFLPAIVILVAFAYILMPFEKMYNSYIQRQIERGWFKWYAWYPVRTGNFWADSSDKYIWLETIECRRQNGYWSKRLINDKSQGLD